MTAEELIKNEGFEGEAILPTSEIKKLMIKFAKYHTEQALLKAADSDFITASEENIFLVNSILNAYPESNIK